jgi:hypothetical protein
MSPHRKEVVAEADPLLFKGDVPMLLQQRVSERGLIGVMGHACIIRLPEIKNSGFFENVLEMFG